MALGVLDAEYKKGITEAAAKGLVIKSIKSSIQRDSASGDGIDILSISKKGIQEESIKL
jgi:proteasome beta subunit